MASFDDASDEGDTLGGAFAALELVPDALTYTLPRSRKTPTTSGASPTRTVFVEGPKFG